MCSSDLPTDKSQVFSTAADNQTAVTIKVFQGEREIAVHNKLLGEFNLEGIAPAPRGMPQIEVTFDIDANGVVSVSAKDKNTGKEQQIKIQSSSGLSEEEIEKMVKDAEANASADKEKKEYIEAKNQAESMIYETEKSLTEHGDKVDSATKSEIESELQKLKDLIAKEGNNATDLKTACDSLMQKSMKLGEAIYKEKQQQETSSSDDNSSNDSSDNSTDEKIVDGEFEEVKEENSDKKKSN